MDKKQQIIIIGASLIGISVSSVLGYWYYKKLKKDELLAEGEADMAENYDLYNPQRSRFYVYNNVSDRFKILKTDESGAERGTKRLRQSGERYKRTPSGYDKRDRFRVSGNIHRKETLSGYNSNKRNANITDLEIPVNVVSRKRERTNLIYSPK